MVQLSQVAVQESLDLVTQAIAQRPAALLDTFSDPVFILDTEFRVLVLNTAAVRTLRMEGSDLLGNPLKSAIAEIDVERILTAPVNTVPELTVNERTFSPRIQTLSSVTSDPCGYVLVLRDISHYKKLNRSQGEFIRIVSHDVRSPLTSMQGFATMLEMVGELNERQKHFVSKILSGISQITALVENIQDAGRYDPESGFYEVTRSHCDVADIMRRVVENHLVPAEKTLDIRVQVAEDLPILNVDANMIERAVNNLVDNAIKYTPSGGTITVSASRDNDHVVIKVQDTGLGISPENQAKLFERHVRIPRKEFKLIKGTGLGLFIVRSVAQRHGGTAWVESQEGQGSTFVFTIPLNEANTIRP
jgi:signal transduction histidine kinase